MNVKTPLLTKKYSDINISDFEFVFIVLSLILLAFITKQGLIFLSIFSLIIAKLFFHKKDNLKEDKKLFYTKNKFTDILYKNSMKHGCKCYMESFHNAFEKQVAYTLSRNLSYKDYFLFNNIILPSSKNTTTQIDHLIVSRFGIFVLDSKDLKGWLFGKEYEEKWTQRTWSGKTYKFQNPIRQNFAHKMAVVELAPFTEKYVYDFVILSDRSELKTPPINRILNTQNMIRVIASYTAPVLTNEQVQLIVGKLSFACQTLDVSIEEHVYNLGNKVNNK